MGRGGGAGEVEDQRERERETQRAQQRRTERERETERWTDGDKRWRASQRPGERRREGVMVRKGSALWPRRPPHPETHRDQSRPPGPQIGQQSMGQIHTLLDTRAQLHSQRHVQHLWERGNLQQGLGLGGESCGRSSWAVPGSCRGRSAGTWPSGS